MTRKAPSRAQSRGPEIKDILVVLICLLGAFCAFKMFWDDFNRTMQRFDDPLGTITYKRQAAQRRFTGRSLWSRLTQGTPIYDGDYIRTAEFSEATMHFTDGTDINLSENTLIQIRTEDGKNVVDLTGGNLAIAAGSGGGGQSIRILVAGENRVELEAGASLNATFDENGGFVMQVLEGTVSANGVQLSAGEAFSTQPEEARAAPLSPPLDARFYADPSVEVNFSWSPQNYSGPSRLDLARDRRFARVIRNIEVSAGQNSVSAPLVPGVYWWRVYPEGGTLPGAAGKITVISSAPPVLLSPADGLNVYLETAPSVPDLRFLWNAGAQDQGDYTLQLADNSAFSSPRVSVTVQEAENASYTYSGSLGPGSWYWRVQLAGGLIGSQASFSISEGYPPAEIPTPVEPVPEPEPEPVPVPVVVVQPPPEPVRQELPPLAAPRRLSPADNYVIGIPELQQSRSLNLSWAPVDEADGYIFTLYREGPSGRSRVLGSEGPQTSFTIEDIARINRGSFVWQVEAVQRRNGIIERRGIPGEYHFTVDIPIPGNPQVHDPGVLYGQ